MCVCACVGVFCWSFVCFVCVGVCVRVCVCFVGVLCVCVSVGVTKAVVCVILPVGWCI